MKKASSGPSTSALKKAGSQPSTSAVKKASSEPSTSAVKKAGSQPSTSAVKKAGSQPSTSAVKKASSEPSTSAVKKAGSQPSTSAVKKAGSQPSTSAVIISPPSPVLSTQPSVVEISSSPVKPDTELWIPELGLYKIDRKCLESSDMWLNDNIISAAQTLLCKQSEGKILGWQSTQCSKRKQMFAPLPPHSTFIQMLHISGCHWILASNITISDGSSLLHSVGIYDSLGLGSVSLSTKKQICSFVCPKCDTYLFDLMNIQRQSNSSDCGLFVIACATELVHGCDPVLCMWDCSQMRVHLLHCLEEKQMCRFPCTKRRRVPLGSRVKKSIREQIYCLCRMPNDKTMGMTECTRCLKWFHNECVGLEEIESDIRSLKWICGPCSEMMIAAL